MLPPPPSVWVGVNMWVCVVLCIHIIYILKKKSPPSYTFRHLRIQVDTSVEVAGRSFTKLCVYNNNCRAGAADTKRPPEDKRRTMKNGRWVREKKWHATARSHRHRASFLFDYCSMQHANNNERHREILIYIYSLKTPPPYSRNRQHCNQLKNIFGSVFLWKKEIHPMVYTHTHIKL